MNWTEADIARLRELAATGLTCSKIGAEMGLSRNAVIGKMGRLRNDGAPVKLAHNISGRGELTEPRKPRQPKPERITVRPEPPEVEVSTSMEPPELGYFLTEFPEDHRCKYPVEGGGQRFWCGIPHDNPKSYCSFHHKICYQQINLSARGGEREAYRRALRKNWSKLQVLNALEAA